MPASISRCNPRPLRFSAFWWNAPGRLLTKEELLRVVWPDSTVEENNLNKNISLLRKVLGDHERGQSYIETVPRLGYRFVASVMHVEPPAVIARATVAPAVTERRQESQWR